MWLLVSAGLALVPAERVAWATTCPGRAWTIRLVEVRGDGADEAAPLWAEEGMYQSYYISFDRDEPVSYLWLTQGDTGHR